MITVFAVVVVLGLATRMWQVSPRPAHDAQTGSTPAAAGGDDSLFDAMPDLMCQLASDGRILRANRAWTRILGHPVAAVPAMRLGDLVHPDERSQWLASLSGPWGEAEPISLTVRCRRGDGSYRLLEWRVADPAADGTRAASARDITERDHHMAGLRREAQRFRLALTAAQAGTWEWDLRSGENIWSEDLWRLYGLDPARSQPGYDAWLASIHPDDCARVVAVVQEAVRTGTGFSTEWRVADEEGRWLLSRGHPIRGSDGRLECYVGIVIDVTVQKRAEHDRDEHQAFLQRIIETVPVPICFKDATGIIRGFNPAFAAFQGPAAAGSIGHATPQVYSAEQIEQARRQDQEILARGGRQEFLMTIAVGGGGTREVMVIKATYNHADGSVAGLLTLFIDLTERVRGEKALRAALERADAANVAKSQFLATMSHEIRTPLNGIIGMTDMLLEGGLNEEQTGMATVVQECGRSLLAVIGDVLDLARIESGRLALETCAFEVRQQMAAIHGMFAAAALAKGLRLTVQVDPVVPERLRGDEVRLRQVLVNLVGNAVKFTDRGEVAVRVVLAGTAPGGPLVLWEVSDTGPGIPAGFLPRLFEPFSQADGSSARRHGGSGLGLAIAKRLSDLMGATLDVDTGQGRGTTFRLCACLQPVAGTSAALSGEMMIQRPRLPVWRRQPVVLVVEDEPICQLTIRAMLSELGCRHQLAEDGDAGVAMVGDGGFDLVLMDCQMPGCDGYTASGRIRVQQAAASSRLPIIALSANVFTEDRERCAAAGMDEFLAKPCTLDALRACLHRNLATLLAGEMPR